MSFLAACHHAGAPLKPYVALVADHGSHDVAVVSLASFARVRTIGLGFAPVKLTVRPGGRDIYVSSETGQIAVIRYPAQRLSTQIQCGHGSIDLCFAPGGRRAYALASPGKVIYVIDCQHRRVIHQIGLPASAVRIALTPNGNTLLAEAAFRLLFIDPQSGQIRGNAALGRQPGPLVIVPSGLQAFVVDSGDQTVTAVDLAGRRILANIDMGAPQSFLALKPDGGEVFAFSGSASRLTILDANTDSVEQNLPTGNRPVSAVFRRDSSVLYIANAGDGTVTTLDVNNRAVTSSARVGLEPYALALSPDERFLAVTDLAGASLSILRTRTSALLTSIPVGIGPVDVVIPDWHSEDHNR